MRAGPALFVLTLVCASGAGCDDDRAKVAAAVFTCNPLSHTADSDCGKGFVCYNAVQSVGASICVARCNPDDPSTCRGACTAAGECLERCKVEDPKSCATGAGATSCIRISISPLDVGDQDGVCLPVNAICSADDECTSPVFNTCTSGLNGASAGAGLEKSGSICIQGGCFSKGTACEPGSSCLRQVLPASIKTAPDVCLPDCLERNHPDGGVSYECMVGQTCMRDAFPQLSARACAPGFAGWLCIDSLGCQAGRCDSWDDVSPIMANFRTCSPSCNSDDDCVPYDRGGNPSVISKFTCQKGVCRDLQSLLFVETCLRDGDSCALDPDAVCKVSASTPASSSDGGVVDGGALDAGTSRPSGCAGIDVRTPLGALGGQAANCVRHCQTSADCATLSQNAHVPHACVGLGAGAPKQCAPSLPFITPCQDDSTCLGDLKCLTPVSGPAFNVCTRTCNSSQDCQKDPALGATFACVSGQCAPRTASGCTPPQPIADLCISGVLVGSTCSSPSGWTCDSGGQCQSGTCTSGRCK